ncbi:MAG TPA: hypothetical protein VHP33_02135 [Polyangiaceae bacterium]|nr:hypothetical protein [Polyangiaceae bacterium]
MFDRVTVGAKAWSSTVKAFDSVANATDRLGPGSGMVSMLQKASDPFGYGGNALSKVLGEFGATSRAMSNVARLSKVYDGMPSMAERLFGKLR